MNTHLSSQQIEAMLAGDTSLEMAGHLQDCPRCAGEVDSLRRVFGNLRQATAASAEHHRPLASVSATPRRVPALAWGLAAAALLIGVATPLAIPHHEAADPTPVAHASAGISDEALLDGVSSDLSASVPDPLLPLASNSSSSSTGTSTSNTNSRKN